MRQFYYAIRSLLRERGTLVIKILSLTFGLLMGLLLLARVGFELNFDRHYKEVNHLMRVKAYYTIGDAQREEPTTYIFSPLPEAVRENFPEEVDCATVVTRRSSVGTYYNENHRYDKLKSIYADSYYFRTMGIDVLREDPEELTQMDCLFISERIARQMFEEEDPIGKVIYRNKNYPLIVRGVFRDLPENTTLYHDVVISLPTLNKVAGYRIEGWNKEDSFFGYVRLKGTDPSEVNARLDEMILKYMPDNGEDGLKVDYFLEPITQHYTGIKEIQMMILIMTLLALVVLGIASLNYVLVSVSSLGQRAKAIGIHKCSGATNGSVLRMFMMETGIVILISLLLVAVLIFNIRDFVEDVACASLGALLTLRTAGGLLIVVLLLFLLTGFLPGKIFSRIPVTQVFRRYTERKTRWKRPLLFIQFLGVSFIYALLMVVLLQYNHLLSKPLGYEPKNVAVAETHSALDSEFLKGELKRMPMVEEVGMAFMGLLDGWGATPIRSVNGKTLFTSRWNSFDKDYLPLMGIRIKEGKNIDADNQILINEAFVEALKMTESPVGKPLPESGREGIVVGVMEDFPVDSWYNPMGPVMVEAKMISPSFKDGGHIAVRVRDLTSETLAALNAKMEEIYPQEEVRFKSLNREIESRYQSARRFRDVVIMTSVVILLITFVGLVGYVKDEVRRRSKEIAIRKVNGAEVNDILSMISKDLLWTSLTAILTGTITAYFVGGFWLEQFHEKVALNPLLFAWVAIGILLLIFATVVIKAWRVANENPVKSIKSE